MEKTKREKALEALHIVREEAKERYEYHNRLVGKKPLGGWTQERHDAYHKEHANNANVAYKFCFGRQMQINPD